MEQAQRVNTAIKLLGGHFTSGEVVSALIARFAISSRQAHRYLQLAQAAPEQLSLPEAKSVFTVKLAGSLIREVRSTARRRKQRISDLTDQALRTFLHKTPHG